MEKNVNASTHISVQIELNLWFHFNRYAFTEKRCEQPIKIGGKL